MVDTLVQWSEAAQKGGPWFLVVIMATVVVLVIRHHLKTAKEKETKIEGLHERIDEIRKEESAAKKDIEDRYREAMRSLSQEHADTMESFAQRSRDEHEKRNGQFIELSTTLTKAITEGSVIQVEQTKTLDRLSENINDLIRK